MKFTGVFAAIFAATVVVVDARPHETNASRMARGLPPMAPVRRATSVLTARKSKPSGGINNSCNTGPVQCCNSVTTVTPKVANTISSLLGIVLEPNTAVGFTCSPLSAVGLGSGGKCNSQPVCCQGNKFKGLVAVGCSPVNINA